MAEAGATNRVTVRRREIGAQYLLQCLPDDAPSLAAALGVDLPAAMLRGADAGGWRALHLTPEGWLLAGAAEGVGALLARFATAPGRDAASLVDVSDRSLGFEIDGADARLLLAGGCPLDLDDAVFPDGACTRTLFGKITITLWRSGERFVIEYGRSYDSYVRALIAAIRADIAFQPPS